MKSLFNVSCKALVALVTCAALLISGSAYAQNVIKGKVIEAGGEPIIGASVIIPGTTTGAVTDLDGVFELKVAEGTTVEVSCIGFTTVQIKAVNGMTVTLTDDTTFLDEVVVVGYGVQKKSDVTGAVARIGEEDINVRPVNNAFEAMQGKIAGVDITSSERPGTVGSIYIRGQRSISAETSPLYVVDGVPLQAGGIDTINPRDIESIDILKDASSTAIYGSRGANGVVLVTTKKGKAGKFHLDYNGTVTVEKLIDKQPAMDADEYITWRRWAYYNSNPTIYTPGDQPNYDQDQKFFNDCPTALANVNKGWASGSWDGSKVENTDWASYVTRTGVSTEHTLSASGGTDKMRAFGSFGYLSNQGTQMGQEYERFNLATSVDIQATKWFKFVASINASRGVQKYGYSRTGQSSSSGPVDIYSAAKALPRYTVPFDEDGAIVTMPGGSTLNAYTVIEEYNKSTDNRTTTRILGSFAGILDFGQMWKPLEGLTFKIAFGPDFRNYQQGIFISSDSAVKMGSKNYAKWENDNYLAYTFDQQIDWHRTFGKHEVGVTLLHTNSKYSKQPGSITTNNVPNEEFMWYNMGSVDVTDASTYGTSVSTGLTESQLESYMARVNYSFADKYLLTASFRRDGSSVLASGHKWANFPSVAVGWRIDQENFMRGAKWIDMLKLRVGWGKTGNAGVDPYGTLGNIQSFRVPFGDQGVLAYATNEPYYTSSSVQMSNKELGWEITSQFNYGIDYSFWKGRLNGVIDFYHSTTDDLLLAMTIPTLTGFSSTTANIGKTKNHGLDFTITGVPVSTRNFSWTSSLNFGWVKDQIVELANGAEDDIANAWFIGQSIQVYYGYANAGLWQESDAEEMAKFNANGSNFTAGSVRPVDQNGDYKIDADDRVILGNKRPSVTGGWVNTFNLYGFELGIEMYGRFGYMISTGGEGQLGMYAQRKIDYWTPSNTTAKYQKPVYSTAGGDAYSSLLGFEDAGFIKLRNISLGYNFSDKVCKTLHISGLKVYAQAKNLGDIWSTCDYIDLDLGTSYYNRGFTFGAQIGF